MCNSKITISFKLHMTMWILVKWWREDEQDTQLQLLWGVKKKEYN